MSSNRCAISSLVCRAALSPGNPIRYSCKPSGEKAHRPRTTESSRLPEGQTSKSRPAVPLRSRRLGSSEYSSQSPQRPSVAVFRSLGFEPLALVAQEIPEIDQPPD